MTKLVIAMAVLVGACGTEAGSVSLDVDSSFLSPESQALLSAADTDGDGFISLAEFGAMERPGRLPEEKRAEIFKRFDKDGDGRLTPREFATTAPKPAAAPSSCSPPPSPNG